ncbi:MAG TPA: hypothetical protein VF802_08775 [Candidatus Limnocylindrales bacterium]
MHRRPLSRGRRLAVIGALVVAVACLLPWYTIGGEASGIPARSVNAFAGLAGLLVFLAALGVPALVSLPYASGDRPVSVDRWPAYLLLLAIAVGGVALTILSIVAGDLLIEGFRPDRAPGVWLALVGLVVLARATFEVWEEPVAR